MDRATRIARIVGLARWTRWALIFFWSVFVFFVVVIGNRAGERWNTSVSIVLDSPSDSQRIVAGLGAAVLFVALVYGAYSFERMLRLYEQGQIFGQGIAQRMRGLGTAMLVYGVLQIFWSLIFVPGQILMEGSFTIGLDFDGANVSCVAFGLVFWIMAFVMREASDLATEVELTV